MVATTAPFTLARPPAQGRSASRIASDRQGSTWISPEDDVSEPLARRLEHAAAARCISHPRPHRRDAHRGRCRFSGQTRVGRYCRARSYHPTRQRFISEDPLETETGEANFYVYVGNDPINYIDPLGLDKECSFGDRFCQELCPDEPGVDRRSVPTSIQGSPVWGHGSCQRGPICGGPGRVR